MKHPGFPGSSDGKEPACNAGDPGLIPSTLLYPRKQEITLMWMGACSPSVGRGHSIARDMESGAKKPVLNIHTHFVISLIYYYSPNCLDSLLMGHSKPKFLCPVNSSQILLLLCVKKYKRCLLWPLLRSHLLWELCVHELKLFLLLLLVSHVNFIISPATGTREEQRTFPSPWQYHFHLMTDCCWKWPTSWQGSSDNTQLMISLVHMINWHPTFMYSGSTW